MLTDAQPVLFVIWYRPEKGHRWVKAGRTSTHAEAVAMIGGKGDWHIAPLYNADVGGDGLFADESADRDGASEDV
jgi:hypothetical protein